MRKPKKTPQVKYLRRRLDTALALDEHMTTQQRRSIVAS